ncbi:unnamed protein product [Arabis nemorensis]|uniref:Uncharacterized protein n=1 Tax=Arabis nemorensis TaxID=586526 RepID=A0A565B1K2_9BRAS|nr:unnamed protein product [Arabis nemorensis]
MVEVRSMNAEATGHDDESFFDSDQHDGGGNSTELNRKIGELESRNHELVRDNGEISRKIQSLTVEIEELRGGESKAKRKMGEMEREIDKSYEERKVLEAIAARASELETEVARLNQELVTAVTEGEEATTEAKKLWSKISHKGDGVTEKALVSVLHHSLSLLCVFFLNRLIISHSSFFLFVLLPNLDQCIASSFLFISNF